VEVNNLLLHTGVLKRLQANINFKVPSSLIKHEQYLKMDQSVTSVQFMVENFLPSFVPSLQNSPNKVLSLLFPFEALKVYIRLRILFFSPNRVLFSETLINNVNVNQTLSPDQLNSFQLQELDLDQVEKNKSNMKCCTDKIKENLQKLTKAQKFFSFSRSAFDVKENPFARTEKLRRSKRVIGVSLPFKLQESAKSSLVSSKNSQEFRKAHFMNLLSETIYIIRPVLYCFFLRFLGPESWKPFLLNLAIDLIWIFIHFLFNHLHRIKDKNSV
jgi:hypothetical protein